MTSNLPSLHATFLDALIKKLAKDPRFDAVLAGGSMVHGGFDAFSDIDLVLVVRDDVYAQVMAERGDIARDQGGLLAAFTGEHVGEPRLLICLYGPELLHVDLKFVILSDLTRLVERPLILWARDAAAVSGALDRARIAWPDRAPQWFEDRAWTWLHYAAVKLQRGELFEAIGTIAFFRDAVLGPMLHRRAGRPQRGVRKLEQAGIAQALLPTVATHGTQSVAAGLTHAMRLYLELRADQPPETTIVGMPELLLPLLEVPAR
ncbi:nucleotidyltransferase domain-containing protein [Devosia ginsengisoli]|uniref:Nucleotidyltransferase domain-containing protein n=1 Tax=Devosia ginsengisoli TaxID=400770 RepID=A0A5B8LXR5_9HYPH|nr:nucleotidyltransferase domain-containing protein [Devosia ginsengisoli]QDZ13107.1 nucleotidyltransferase domain-containing protein [Devosia ginsengisoli]